MDIQLIRIDDRLIHGQVVVGWVKALNIDRLVVVNDAIAKNSMQKTLMEMAVPSGLKVSFYTVEEAAQNCKAGESKDRSLLSCFPIPRMWWNSVNQRARGVVRAASPYWNPSRCGIDHQPHHAQPLFFVQRRRFSGRTAGHDEVDSRLNLPVHQRPQRRLVDRSIRPERRHNCGTAAYRFHDRSSL